MLKIGAISARFENRRRIGAESARLRRGKPQVSLILTCSASFFLCQKVLLDVTVRARLFIGNLTDKELEVEVGVELLVTNHVCEG